MFAAIHRAPERAAVAGEARQRIGCKTRAYRGPVGFNGIVSAPRRLQGSTARRERPASKHPVSLRPRTGGHVAKAAGDTRGDLRDNLAMTRLLSLDGSVSTLFRYSPSPLASVRFRLGPFFADAIGARRKSRQAQRSAGGGSPLPMAPMRSRFYDFAPTELALGW